MLKIIIQNKFLFENFMKNLVVIFFTQNYFVTIEESFIQTSILILIILKIEPVSQTG